MPIHGIIATMNEDILVQKSVGLPQSMWTHLEARKGWGSVSNVLRDLVAKDMADHKQAGGKANAKARKRVASGQASS